MTKSMKRARRHQMTRRDFVGGALTAAGVIAGAPALLRGRNLNGKLNIAFIACGGRANTNIRELTIGPGRAGPSGAGAGRASTDSAPTRATSSLAPAGAAAGAVGAQAPVPKVDLAVKAVLN